MGTGPHSSVVYEIRKIHLHKSSYKHICIAATIIDLEFSRFLHLFIPNPRFILNASQNPFVTSPGGVTAKYCDEYVCMCVYVSVCLSGRISPEPHARSLPNFLCMLPTSVTRSSSGMLTIGRIAYWREGVTGVHSAGEV